MLGHFKLFGISVFALIFGTIIASRLESVKKVLHFLILKIPTWLTHYMDLQHNEYFYFYRALDFLFYAALYNKSKNNLPIKKYLPPHYD